jgi:hypothetical protein
MNTPYTDRMNAIARLRMQRAAVESQINDEIAKAWRLSPSNNVETFAQTLGLLPEDVRLILESKGIVVRTQVTE